MKNNTIIIVATGIFILASMIYLSVVERKQADINTKNIWMIYFENPKNNSLDFTIENHSENNTFHWTVLSDKEQVKEGDVSLAKGSSKKIPLAINGVQDKKITIVVTANNETKEIYKILQ